MNALFVICPSLGIGEVYTAVRLSEQLIKSDWNVYFLGNEILVIFHEINKENRWILSNDTKDNYRLLEELVQHVNPDLFIFTDYNMYIKNSYTNFAFDFHWLNNFGIPCMVIDTIGNCRFQDTDLAIYKDKSFALTLPDWVEAILRPVPPNDPINPENRRVIHFSVFAKSEELSVEAKLKIKQEFNVSQNKKLVIFPLGHWIKLVAGKDEKRLYENMMRIILGFFNKLEFDIELVLLGDKSWSSGVYNNVSLRTNLADLSFSKTEELMRAADLVITINRFSNSLGRAARYRVPALCLINNNDIIVEKGKILTDLEYKITPFIDKVIRLVTKNNGLIKKFSIFPENDTGFINEFYNKNPRFSEIIPVCEIFDQVGTVNMVHKLLTDGRDELMEKQSYFINYANDTMQINKIMEFL